MRDIFTMGARPLANLNALRFGDMAHPKTRHLVNGVVAGIAGYGNCMGVPTVGGETNFHAAYNGNILVNAMTVGLADADKIFYASGAGVDQPVVYVGSKTGRDGIHGATMASAEFSEDAEDQRPTVQVGDPFTEKLLLEACLELMREDAIISIQDMGAAGLTSSSVEIAAKGDIGIFLDLDHVPMREKNMLPYEIMLSESQERMLMILKPGREDQARKIFEKWDLDFAVIGRTTDDKHMKISMYGRVWCNIPVPPLVDEAPVYDRPRADLVKPAALRGDYPLPEGGLSAALVTLMSCADLCSRRWIWEQYDSLVRGETLAGPGIGENQTDCASDAALVHIPETDKLLAMSSDCTPRYCKADPFEGGKQAVAESYRNLTASGAKPLAVTNNLNFGNPEKPDIMAQFAGCIEGMAEACKALDYPVVSGNVSLYNETDGQAILPTPVIGGVGIVEQMQQALYMGFAPGQSVFLIGGAPGHLGQSLYLREIHLKEDGAPPPVDLVLEKNHADLIHSLNAKNLIGACHDVSDGGILVALAEMALSSPRRSGIRIDCDIKTPEFWFGEDQALYIVATSQPDELLSLAAESDIPVVKLGETTPGKIIFADKTALDLEELRQANENPLPAFMNG